MQCLVALSLVFDLVLAAGVEVVIMSCWNRTCRRVLCAGHAVDGGGHSTINLLGAATIVLCALGGGLSGVAVLAAAGLLFDGGTVSFTRSACDLLAV